MLVNHLTRRVLASRKEQRHLTKLGYRRHETDWEIHRGYASFEEKRIIDAKVSVDGLYVYTLVGTPPKEPE